MCTDVCFAKFQMHTEHVSIRVRPIYREEIDDALCLIHQSIREINAKDYTPTQIAKIVHLYHRAVLANGTVIVAEHRSKIVGVAKARLGFFIGQSIEAVFTHPQFINKGIGRALVTELERKANLRNLPKLSVMASITAVDFYEALNYERIGEMPISGGIQCVLMEKQLRPATIVDHVLGVIMLTLCIGIVFSALYALTSLCIQLLIS